MFVLPLLLMLAVQSPGAGDEAKAAAAALQRAEEALDEVDSMEPDVPEGLPGFAFAAAQAVATVEREYRACGLAAQADAAVAEYRSIAAAVSGEVPDTETYLTEWRALTAPPDGEEAPPPGCSDWQLDQAERFLTSAMLSFREEATGGPRRTATWEAVAPGEAALADARFALGEAQLFARGAVARALAEHMRCGRAAEGEALERRLLAIEASAADGLDEFHGSWAERKYEAGQSRAGAWPKPPGHLCLAEDRAVLDRDADDNLEAFAEAAARYRQARQ